jgi:hypothetical protein
VGAGLLPSTDLALTLGSGSAPPLRGKCQSLKVDC